MSYKPDEATFMAYLYGELEGEEKEKFEQYLFQHAEAQQELQQLRDLRKMLGRVSDKEVITPSFFVGENKSNHLWNWPYLKTIVSVAASLIFVIVIGKFSDLHIRFHENELSIAFGEQGDVKAVEKVPQVTAEQVKEMIYASMAQSNSTMQSTLKESQQKLNSSIQKNLVANSNKIDKLVVGVSLTAQEQIQSYMSALQNENAKLVKDYFKLTAADQKKYIESMLVDFAKYLQQQRNNDLQVVQTRLNSLEKNTDTFKQETEQILSSIITSSGNSGSQGIKN